MADMQVQFGRTTLRNPVILAAGTSGVMGEIGDAINLSTLGAITTKSITRKPRIGNKPTRIAEHPTGMLNAIGLANDGVDTFNSDYGDSASTLPTTVIGSIAGHTIEDYVAVAEAMDSNKGISLIEINVSCPNTADGLEFGACPVALENLLSEIKSVLTNTEMIVKLSIAPGNLIPHARASIEAGAIGLTLINTVPALSIDVQTKKPILTRGIGGYSGKGIHPIAVRVVHEVYRDIAMQEGIPIIGTGGILKWQDAAEFILAGATAVGIGTASFINPSIAPKVAKKLHHWASKQGCNSITELTGSMITS